MFKLCWLWLLTITSYAWDANGHVLVSRLAYQYISPQTRVFLHRILFSSQTEPQVGELDLSSIWLDKIRFTQQTQLQQAHYINLPFGDAQYFQAVHRYHAVLAVQKAMLTLNNSAATKHQRQLAIKIILHVVADLHQPLHTVNYYSRRFSAGDKGGNAWRIKNKIFHGNLHQFWDHGGGWLSGWTWQQQDQLQQKLSFYQQQTCDLKKMSLNPWDWAHESYHLAVTQAYFPPKGREKFLSYQANVQHVSQTQIQLAACRLAAVLENSVKM